MSADNKRRYEAGDGSPDRTGSLLKADADAPLLSLPDAH